MASYPLVDVYIFTYNHEAFIARALEGVLTQETSFPFRITILEDYSTDTTRAIVKRFANEHPDKIDLILHERNLCSNRPFVEALSRSQAMYVALLDGDDYWTSAHKLQRQVDVLNEQSNCALCSHQVQVVDDHGKVTEVWPPEDIGVSTISDLLADSVFLYTCSVLYRRSALSSIPDWVVDSWSADRILNVLAAASGDIAYIHEPMAVYREHSGGLWTGKSPVEKGKWAVEGQLELLEHLDPVYRADILKGLVHRYLYLARAQAAEKEWPGLVATLREVGALEQAIELGFDPAVVVPSSREERVHAALIS